MADIELVIKIPEKTYKQLKFLNEQGFGTVIDELVVNGTLLPKGHGRLIDADELNEMIERELVNLDDELSNAFDDGLRWGQEKIIKSPTIIEADKENEE